MVNQRTMFLCPSCSCHARRSERECPHCGAALEREAGSDVQRSIAALAMGLAMAVALPLAGCGDDTGGGNGGGGGSGGDDASSSSGDNLAGSTYGVASSSNASSGDASSSDASASSGDNLAGSTYGVASAGGGF